MTAPVGASIGWALIPVVLWLVQVVTGLTSGPELCRFPAALHLTTGLLVAVSVFAVYRSWSLTRAAGDSEASHGVVGHVGFKVGLLFTAGIVLAWVMTGLGTCL